MFGSGPMDLLIFGTFLLIAAVVIAVCFACFASDVDRRVKLLPKQAEHSTAAS